MVRIKIITCHDVYNAGASLQAYALSTYLKGLGYDVEIIDYKPYYLCTHFPLWGVANPKYDKPLLREIYNLLKLPKRIKARTGGRKKEFDSFTREYLALTPVRYSNIDQLRMDTPIADVYLAGSDQIWNCFFENGKDPAFYLDFVPEHCIKASYAASFAQESIPEEWKSSMRNWLLKMDFVSVREKSGVTILEELGIENGIQVLDPVFLLTPERWLAVTEQQCITVPYIFLYDFDNNDAMGKSVKAYAREKGWKVFSYFPNKYCDRSFEDYGPKMFLALVQNASLVVSNSFHATAFSLLFEKQFWVVKRNEQINTRMVDLLALVDLEDRIIDGTMCIKDAEINYSCAKNKLKGCIDQSKQYISQVIEKAYKK